MKNIFKFTFLSIEDIKKFALLVIIISILTLIEPFPFLGITANLFEKLIILSSGIFLIHIMKHSKDETQYFENLKKNGFGSFLLHFIPPAAGILIGLMVISAFWLFFFVLILEFTNSIYIVANPHMVISNMITAPFITQVLIGFYSIYLLFFSYIFLGKFGAALTKENFKGSFLSIVSSLIDFQFWIRTFNFRYFIIYLVWSILVFFIYIFTIFGYIFLIYPAILHNSVLGLIAIPLLAAIYTILAYFTFFSSYFAYKSTKD